MQYVPILYEVSRVRARGYELFRGKYHEPAGTIEPGTAAYIWSDLTFSL
jgi:hypothetical protein